MQKGLTNKEIATLLRLIEQTIKHYTGLISKKFRVRNKVQANFSICDWVGVSFS